MVPEAVLKDTDTGLVPEGDGWFVVNARDAVWWRSDAFCDGSIFEGEARFPELGFHLEVLQPGEPNCLYHGESNQEDFLVVSGECVVILDGEERRLQAWDFVHCPPWADHVFVGAGDGPCVIVMVGGRNAGQEVLYPVNEVAAKYGASALEETPSPKEAYSRFEPPAPTRYQEGSLP